MDKKTLQYEIGQKVVVRYEGSLVQTTGTVTARDEQWLDVELQGSDGPYALRFGYDYEEEFWYDEPESGNWAWIGAA